MTFLVCFGGFPGRTPGIQRGFRSLRRATQGAALRTRKPFEKGLSESFISPAGGTKESSVDLLSLKDIMFTHIGKRAFMRWTAHVISVRFGGIGTVCRTS